MIESVIRVIGGWRAWPLDALMVPLRAGCRQPAAQGSVAVATIRRHLPPVEQVPCPFRRRAYASENGPLKDGLERQAAHGYTKKFEKVCFKYYAVGPLGFMGEYAALSRELATKFILVQPLPRPRRPSRRPYRTVTSYEVHSYEYEVGRRGGVGTGGDAEERGCTVESAQVARHTALPPLDACSVVTEQSGYDKHIAGRRRGQCIYIISELGAFASGAAGEDKRPFIFAVHAARMDTATVIGAHEQVRLARGKEKRKLNGAGKCILNHFRESIPRIAILGAGGMGKTSLASAALHHEEVVMKSHWGPSWHETGQNLTQAVLHRLSEGPPTLLPIFDNLETAWEPAECRKDIEEFLSLLTDMASLRLIITMRGAERPSKVQWTRPFLPPLERLAQDAARKMFIDIAEDRHSIEEIDAVLQLTDNMPLSVSLLAHAVDVEGCNAILLCWQREHTYVISEGYDRRSNLELSISLSLASPRITSVPHSQELLSLLSLLPDGLSDAELKQSNFAIQDILNCKRALLPTALPYTDDHKRLKALVPIREYMAKSLPPTDEMIRPLFKHFQELLQVYAADMGKQSSALYVERLTSNYANILNIILNELHAGHHDLADIISCTMHFI
ncbi:hypothetical protein B0H16DRAFT_1861653 [Mycena metata]|uniref:NACHT domain-containing protein n=1 Tax=Mycena metata TaxID=1033252 RepID=A0AAD7IGF9_9AGAR|nr:hypothetical protein B0H16DRAFT_1861653 [Mycena metata]